MAGTIRPSSTRVWTAARILGRLGAETTPARSCAHAEGRFAELTRTADVAPQPAVAPHPSWPAAAVRSLPAPVARRYLDRLGPLAAAVADELDHETARGLAATPPADASPLMDAIVGRSTPGRVPQPPAWARPLGIPGAVASAIAREGWPFLAGREAAVERAAEVAACAAAAEPYGKETGWPDRDTACGLARLAFGLVRHPDEVWGLAGAWPRPAGAALLVAWNAWPDLGALEPDAADAVEAARRRLLEGWRSWAA